MTIRPSNNAKMQRRLFLFPKSTFLKSNNFLYHSKVFSQTDKIDEDYLNIRNYIISWIKKSGRFSKNRKWTKWIPMDILTIMRLLNYDAFIYLKNRKIVGHIFFQWHGEILHVFSVFIDSEYQNTGVFVKLIADFLNYISNLTKMKKIRIGAGGYIKEDKLLAVVGRIKRLNNSFEIQYLGNYYFRLQRETL